MRIRAQNERGKFLFSLFSCRATLVLWALMQQHLFILHVPKNRFRSVWRGGVGSGRRVQGMGLSGGTGGTRGTA